MAIRSDYLNGSPGTRVEDLYGLQSRYLYIQHPYIFLFPQACLHPQRMSD